MGTPLDLREKSRPLSQSVAASVDAPAHLRGAAIATWHARMINEYASNRVFVALARQLEECGYEEEADEVTQFAEEERQHGALCGAVVEALGGEAKGELFDAPPFPPHRDAPKRAALLR